MRKLINTGLLAYGMSGKIFHAPFIHAHTGFNLVAVTERNKKLAAKDYPSIKSYDTIEALIDDKQIDFIVVNTPNYTHFDYTKQCLLAGKDVLVEKPFTPSVAEAQELFKLAKKLGRKIMVYQNRRYDSGFKITKSIIESKQLGKLNEVYFRFDRYRNEIGKKNFKENNQFEASGLLYDLGPHLIDQAIALFGKPTNFYKITANNRTESLVDDYFFIHLAYSNNLNVYLTANLLAADIPPAFVMNGTDGSFSKNHGDIQEAQLIEGIKPNHANYGIEKPENIGRLCLVTNNNQRMITHPISPKGNYMELFDEIYQHLANNKIFPITEEDILEQIKILEA